MPSLTINRNKSYIPIILFLLAGILWRTTYYKFSLYIAIPSIIIYCLLFYTKTFFTYKNTYLYFCLIIWILLSSLINPYADVSLREMIPIIGSCLLALSVYTITYKNNHSKFIFISYITLFISLMYMNVTSENFTSDFNYANEAERRNNSILNANSFAYYSLYAIMSVRMLIELSGNKIKPLFLLLIYAVCASVSLYVAMMTASRQVLLLQIPLILMFVYIDFFRKKKVGNKIIILSGIIIFVMLLPYVENIYSSSYLATRSEVGFQEDARNNLLIKGIEQGLENPLFGVGLGVDDFFSHCTYIHLMARCGVPAAILFIIIIFKCLFEQYKRYTKTKSLNFLLYFLCIGIISVGHILYSYIDEPFLMSIMFAIVGVSDKEYKVISQQYT